MKTKVIISKNQEQWIKETVGRIVHQSQVSITASGKFCLALSGGSTPAPVYAALAKRSDIDWQHTYIFWGDERCVPPDHIESNYRSANETLISKIPIPAENIFRMKGEISPPQAAKEYNQALEDFFAGNEIILDLILLGLGEDGHTASLFPGTPALTVMDTAVVENQHPASGMWRISFTYPVLTHAHEVYFLVKGESKAEIVAEIVNNPTAEPHFPAKQVVHKKSTTWLIDQAASINITNSPNLEIQTI